MADKRFSFAYLFAAVEPATGQSACLILPEVSTAATQMLLDSFSDTIAPDVHAALVVDRAGWHVSLDLRVPDDITLVPLPPYAPDLNPVERAWLYPPDWFLSLRLHADYAVVLDTASETWNRLNPDRLQSLTS